MKSSRILLLFSGLLFALTIVSAIQLPRSSYVLATDSGWVTAVNLSWNAVHSWRNDINVWWFVVISSLSALVWFRQETTIQTAAVGTMSYTIAMLALFGLDPVIFRAISFLPLLLAALATYQSEENGKKTPLVCAATLVAVTALQLAPFLATFIALITLCESKEQQRSLTQNFTFVVYLILLLPLLFAPETVFPDYPAFSHIAADDGVPGYAQPLIGQGVPIPIIDRPAQKFLFFIPIVWLLCGATITLVRYRKLSLSIAGFLLTLFVVFDGVIPEEYSLIAPLQALARILPGTFLLSLLPISFAVAVLVCCRVASEKNSKFLFIWLSVGSTLLALPLNWPLRTGAVVSNDAAKISTQFSLDSGTDLNERILTSPSASLFAAMGEEYYTRVKQLQSSRFSSFRGIPFTILTSGDNSPEMIRKMFDGNPGTRWSQGNGNQSGMEWILIRFEEPRTINGIEVSPGNFQTDFPRGLAIYSGSACEGSMPSKLLLSEIAHYSSWQGAIGITSLGFPFYKPQSNVEVIFPAPLETSCLLLRQTGISSDFDWSIAEIKILRQVSPTSVATEP